MNPDSTLPPSDSAPPIQPLNNSERLRAHLTPRGLAITLLDAWNKDNPQVKAMMLAALNDFHTPK